MAPFWKDAKSSGKPKAAAVSWEPSLSVLVCDILRVSFLGGRAQCPRPNTVFFSFFLSFFFFFSFFKFIFFFKLKYSSANHPLRADIRVLLPN